MNYRNAFKCAKCPECNGEKGCPMWWEIIQTNIDTGEERINKACGYTLLPWYLTEVIKASNRPAAIITKMRNALVKELDKGFTVLAAGALLPPPPPEIGHDAPDNG